MAANPEALSANLGGRHLAAVLFAVMGVYLE
jgi:hypothetical protein